MLSASKKKTIFDLLFILLATGVSAFALNTIIIPSGIFTSGVTGISQIINHFIPISIGLLFLILNIPLLYIGYSSTYCLSNKVNLHSIGPDFEILNYRGTLTKVEKKDNLHLFHFRDKKEGIEIMSKATFELKPYSISRIPNKQSYDETKPLSQLIGYTARVRVKCSYDDVVGKIGSIPFKILSIKETEGEITLIGTNNLYIQSKGFQKVRESGDLLFDVYGEKDGYGRTFHLEI